MKPKTKTVVQYPVLRVQAECHKSDYIELEFRNKAIHITTCTDNCGNVFVVPYRLLDGVLTR